MKVRIGFFITGIIVFPFALIVGGRIPYLLLYTYLLTLVIPLIHCLLGKYRLKVTIKAPEKELVAGEEIKITYEINNPLGVTFPRLEFHNDLAYRLRGRREAEVHFYLEKKGSFRRDVLVQCKRRGYFKVGVGRLIIKDIFNLYKLKKISKAPLQLKIYPRVVPLKKLKIQASQHMGELMVKNPLFQDYTSLSDLRTYQEGDSLKKIHWKASAKTDSLMVKNYEEQGDHEVIIMLDSCMKSYGADKEAYVEDKLVDTAASMIDYCLRQNIKVSLNYWDKEGDRVIMGDHPGCFKAFLDQLVSFHPTGSNDFPKEIERTLPSIPQGSTLFLLTPLLSKELGAQGIHLKMKNLRPFYMVIGSEKESPNITRANKALAKRLEGEGIPLYLIDVEQDIRDILEGKYEKGA